MQFSGHFLAVFAIGCLCSLLSGCAETASRVTDTLLMKKSPEQVLGIKTPDDRIKELRTLAKQAKRKPVQEQETIVAELAREIQQENDPMVRRQILRTLGAFQVPMAEAVLVAGLGDSNLETRRVACTSLGTRGGETAVRELTRVATSDTELDVRLAAVKALGQTKNQSALPHLAEALVDPDPAMQAQARTSLSTISGRDYGNDVQAWREFAQTGKTNAREVSLAEKLRRAIY